MLTHEARLAFRNEGVFPASRPELAGQLRTIGALRLAQRLEGVMRGAVGPEEALGEGGSVSP